MIRFMGRVWIEASPVSVEVKGWAERMPEISLVVVPLLTRIQNPGRCAEAVKPFALYGNDVILIFDFYAKTAETANSGKAVCALEKVYNFGFPFGQRTEHYGAVGNGFIAGNGNFPF